jgi:phage terminase large subunit
LIISDAAKKLLEINNGETIHSWYAPPDLWNRRQETGKSAAELFMDNGVYLTKTHNERVQGWYNVKEWIQPYETKNIETGEPIKSARLRIFSNCLNLIRTLPQLQHDDKNPNDVANEPHEITHAPDAIRYFCSARPMTTKEAKPNLTTIQKHKEKLVKKRLNNRRRIM